MSMEGWKEGQRGDVERSWGLLDLERIRYKKGEGMSVDDKTLGNLRCKDLLNDGILIYIVDN